MTVGVVVMAYGSPTGLDDVARYYTDIRRGRAPSPELLTALSARYEQIGGLSPLAATTAAQVAAIARALDAVAAGEYRTYYGAKHAAPSIEKAVEACATHGVERIVGVVLAPHYAAASVGEYLARLGTAAEAVGLPVRAVERYGDDPVLVDLLSERVRAASTPFADDPEGSEILFTAHSLPLRALEPNDPYVAQVEATAALVTERLQLAHARVAWQSAGATADPWLGPDIGVVLDALAADGRRAVVVCPCGFTSDHLEILYDLDIVAARRCADLGLAFTRTRSLNDDPRFASMLAQRIVAA
jgi:ferrochelatase